MFGLTLCLRLQLVKGTVGQWKDVRTEDLEQVEALRILLEMDIAHEMEVGVKDGNSLVPR